jgi:CBS domain-containing protein
MKAKEMMQQSVLTATPDLSLALAWRLMEDHRIRHLPVVIENRLIGMVTDRDILRASPSTTTPHTQAEITVYMGTTPIETYMTQDVITISPEADMNLGTRQMLDGHFGCLPVLAQDRLVGIITEIDLLRGYLVAAALVGGRLSVKDAMQDLMIIVTPEDLVSTAYQRMQGGLVRHLPVLDDADKVVGVITDRDIRRAGDCVEPSLPGQELTGRGARMTVSEIMTTQVHPVRRDTAVTEAAELFLTHNLGCLPVVRSDGTLEGILTATDLLRLCLATRNSGHVSL